MIYVLDAPTITAWATLIAVVGSILIQLRNGKKQDATSAIASDTNKIVNGVHATALDAVVTQAAQIANLTGKPEDLQKLKDAAQASAIQGGKVKQ
jgi:hypothetical protein